MNAFSRSWQVFKITMDVMRKDKELLAFPILAGVFSLLFMLALVLPSILAMIGAGSSNFTSLFSWALLGLLYLGLAFIATFFNVCVVYTTKRRLDGGNATFSESIRFAFSRIHLIFAWSLLAATVGIILRILDNLAQRMEGVGKIIMQILISMLGMAWSIIIVFVVPAMVYDNVGPIDAIKKSVAALKKTWGESLIRYFGLWVLEFVYYLIGIIVAIVLLVLVASLGIVPIIIVLTLAALYIIAGIVFFNLANTIFNTALYAYATTGKVPKGFSDEVVKGAFAKQEKS